MSDSKQRARERLLSDYPSTKEGTWLVKGEDANPDWGGSRQIPTLGYFTGRYKDVVDYALNLPNFFAWGRGGNITEINIRKVDPNVTEQLKDANKELKQIKKREEELTELVKKLGGAS